MKFVKKLSKIISVIIVLSMLLSGVTAFATEREITASGVYGDVNWTLYSDGELLLDGEGVIGKVSGNDSVPWGWNNRQASITQITFGKNVIYDSTSMLLEETKTGGYSSLLNIIVEEGNTSLSTDESGVLFNYDKSALILFPSGKDMDEYTVPDSVTQINNCAFVESKLKKVVIGNSVSIIGKRAFDNCDSLSDIEFKSNKISFGRNAFANCDSLETFVMPEESGVVSQYMFLSCKNLKKVVLHSKVVTISDSAFSGCNKLSEITIPESVTTIGRYAFRKCESLESVTIPDKVTKIDFSVFSGCTNLKEIAIGKGMKTIEYDSFNGCDAIESVEIKSNLSANDMLDIIEYSKNLKKISVGDNNENLSCDGNGVLFNKDKTELLRYPSGKTASEYVIPDTVKRISANAFRFASSLNDITIPQSVEYIGANAFLDTGYYSDAANWDLGFLYIDTNLVAVDNNKVAAECRLPSKTTLIAARVFEESKIVSIDIPESVKHINDYAFIRCTNLEAVDLPDNLETLGIGALYGCSKVKEIEIPSTVPELHNFTFYNATALENIILNDGLESIGEKAFYNTPAFTSVEIPSTVKAIDPTAFDNSAIVDIFYGDTKAEWKRATNSESFDGITIHYTLRNADESVLIQHTDENFIWEAGNVHLAVSEVTPASPKYDRNGYYNKNMINPVKVLDIKIVDGDGNAIQPLSDENITVKIKAPDEFKAMLLSVIGADESVDFNSVEFSEGKFSYKKDGKTVTVSPTAADLNKFKIVHWFSDGTEPGDYEVFAYDRMEILDGYIILQTNHFSDYAVCTDYVEKAKHTITFDTAGGSEIAPITLECGAAITAPQNPEKEGYTFIGWTPEIPDTMPDEDITVVAQYEKIQAPEVIATGIEIIALPKKTSYAYKSESLDLNGIAIKVTYSDGKSEIVTDTEKIEAYGFNADSVGTKTITVSYGGFTDDFEITVAYTWWQMIIRILLLGFLWY